jgi:hypothetical protein
VPIARRLARAKSAGLFPWGNFASSASIATANADKAAERTACRSSQRLAKCLYAALGTTPARLVASRSTTASGPPARASWIPASSSARRRSPWRYVLRSAGLVVVSVTILYVDTVHKAVYRNLRRRRMQVQPYLFFKGRCEEAADFYRRTIGAEEYRRLRMVRPCNSPCLPRRA